MAWNDMAWRGVAWHDMGCDGCSCSAAWQCPGLGWALTSHRQLSTQHQTAPSKPSIRKTVVPPNGEVQRAYSSAVSTNSFTKHPHSLRKAISKLLSGPGAAGGWFGSGLSSVPAGWGLTPPCKPPAGLRQPYAGKEQPARVYWHPLHISFLLPSFLGKFLQGEAV